MGEWINGIWVPNGGLASTSLTGETFGQLQSIQNSPQVQLNAGQGNLNGGDLIQSPVFKSGYNYGGSNVGTSVDSTTVGGTDWGGLAAGVGAGIQGLAALGGLYYQDKNYKLQKDHQNYLKSRDAMADAKSAKFAKNVGNEAVV